MNIGGFSLPSPQDMAKSAVESKLPKPLRQEMEKAFGADLSEVKIMQSHLPTLQGARSFVNGNELHFAPGQYDPFSKTGRQLLVHELTHVVQQRGGRVAGMLDNMNGGNVMGGVVED